MAGYLAKDTGKWSTQGETGKLKPICEKSTGGGLANLFMIHFLKTQQSSQWYRDNQIL